MTVPASHVYALGALLFATGVAGFLVRRNLLVVFLSLELMFNGAIVTLAGAARAHGAGRGTEASTTALFVLFIAAVEVSVGLALVIALFRLRRSVDPDAAAELRG